METNNIDLSTYKIHKEVFSFPVPKEKISGVMKILKNNDLLPRYPKFHAIITENNEKRILLAEGVNELPKEVTDIVGDVELTPYELTLDYNNFSLQDLLKQFLPEGVVIPSSFETIGKIAHLNLLDEQLLYKHIIGQAILLKNTALKTVAIKTGAINNVYRNMNLEVIAGENSFITEVKQTGLTFRMDFSKVYWNSRLEHEHDSLVDLFQEGSIVADAMCGIGPFAIRAAKRKNCTVYANDLNPDSYKWLMENCKINHVTDKVVCSNIDAREFIVNIFKNGGSDYIVMNLPKIAVTFLDAVAEGAKKYRTTARLPIVYFHQFDDKDVNHEASLKEKAIKALGMQLPKLNVHRVRDVSPKKDMFRCSFAVADLFGSDDPSIREIPH
ncbi:tRNA (guanine(37)-N1)-methyltransferase [Histomonas meleagridis]|uniref:tRNA (guanine(37)-N1)-methyltransferase n=1 Tax=Histomonas meleagridis TaxID=135588 RepID=UPI00355AC046|nr:tRNA (guanine(37)-N1)-methyltransferase [Histomonas meleagridis]KAH0800393.1 tRNA (guanine(37)-N1)-methyltransferase [Histomonas meleagridis]